MISSKLTPPRPGLRKSQPRLGLPKLRWLHRIPVLPFRARRVEEPVSVLFFGNYIPLHGVDTIVGAARLLQKDVRFMFTLVVGADAKLTP